MQNKVELELVNERQEQFLELEKGLYSYFYVLCFALNGLIWACRVDGPNKSNRLSCFFYKTIMSGESVIGFIAWIFF